MSAMRGLKVSLALALSVGAFGCMSSATSHDAHTGAVTQTSGAAIGDEGAQARSETAREADRGTVVGGDSDRATRHADRSEGPGTGPDPLPWAPRAGMAPSFERPSNVGVTRTRIENPYNQR